VLVHDLGERPRLSSGLNRLLGPLGRVLRDCWVVGSAEDDLLLLEAVAHRRTAVDAHVDRRDAEGDQHHTGDYATELECLSHLVPPQIVFLVFKGRSTATGVHQCGAQTCCGFAAGLPLPEWV
jgi:hypothetical protein